MLDGLLKNNKVIKLGQAKIRGNFEDRKARSIARTEMRAAKDKFLRENEIIRIAEARRIRERDYPVTHGEVTHTEPRRKRLSRMDTALALAAFGFYSYPR